MMAHTFEDFSVDNIEGTLNRFSLDCVRNFPLVSCLLAIKASQGWYKAARIVEQVKLTKRSPRTFVQLTEADGLACAVVQLALASIVIVTKDSGYDPALLLPFHSLQADPRSAQ